MLQNNRELARSFFAAALAECSIDRAFERHVSCDAGVLRVGDDLFDLRSYSQVLVVSMGKAAHTMAEALVARTGEGLIHGIIAAPTPAPTYLRNFEYYQGGHPLPNADSLRAGAAVLRAAQKLDEHALAIFMISGGASAICETPIDSEISLEDVIATNRVLVHCGAPIAKINAVRKHLSAIKGGRLAQAAYPAQQVSILVSDVPSNATDSLASGPTMPDSSTVETCYAIASEYKLVPQLPASVGELFEKELLEETPKGDDPAFVRARWTTVLSNDTAVEAAARAACEQGFTVVVDNSCDDWDYKDAADFLLGRLRELRKASPRACIVSGGEVTVKVTNGGGVGGRNQQFALYAATKIAGEKIAIVSAGTDGIDGNSDAAGAVVDGTTVARAREAGLDAEAALASFDATPLLERIGDAIVTGPTGNNVRDLRVLLAYE